ncbi:hypothetical protein, partial [Escherichia coli]|uniref:hypothetical protein n=1 Tax=Escherichia coli TaxID=562 RepID=UPI00335027EA
TQQVENLRPDTACGLQAEKTGRFSLHRRDNTRPDKHCASGNLAFAISSDSLIKNIPVLIPY